MTTQAQTIGIAVICFIAAIALCGLIVVILICLRVQKKQKQEYVRIAIEKSLNRQVVMGPTIAEKREDALLNAQYFLRDAPFELETPLWGIGSSDKKYHFKVKSYRHPGEFLLTLQAKGEKCKLPLQSLSLRQTVKNLLKELKHPYILPVVETDFLQGQKIVLLTIRPYSEKRGSLRDLVYRAKPGKSYSSKYSDPKKPGKPLGIKYIRQFGRQILEALDFLQVLGYPYPDLHCGNVIIDQGMCKLTDYENIILGEESRYEHFTKNQTQLRCFGNVLFEMACGFEPTKKDIKHPPENCNHQVVEIFQAIYFDESPPSLDDLIAHPFFNVVPKGLTDTSGEETDMKPDYIEVLQVVTGQKALITKKKKKRPPPPAPSSSATSSQKSMSSSSSNTSSQKVEPIKSPPPPPASLKVPKPAGAPDRTSLLSDIRNPNVKLKKVEEVNDRSSPLI